MFLAVRFLLVLGFVAGPAVAGPPLGCVETSSGVRGDPGKGDPVGNGLASADGAHGLGQEWIRFPAKGESEFLNAGARRSRYAGMIAKRHRNSSDGDLRTLCD